MAEVGEIMAIVPTEHWYAVTTISRPTSAKSAIGARTGMASVARPDELGTRNDSGIMIRYIMMANRPLEAPLTTLSIECSTVSVIWALCMITVMPRASTITSAAPIKSAIPARIAL